LGLSLRHISPPAAKARRKSWSVVIAKGGRLFRLLGPELLSRSKKWTGKKRGQITGFSSGARRRMFFVLNSLNRTQEGLPLLLTLTYPGSDRWNRLQRDDFKRHLDSFWKRLERAYPNAHAIWKLEPQQRGAPHYHLLVFGVDFIPNKLVSRMWWEVVGSGEIDNLKNGVDLQQARSWPAVGSYVSKYVAKVVDHVPVNWTAPGRWWGRLGRNRFSIDLEAVTLSQVAAQRLRRLFARMRFPGNRERQLEFLSMPSVGLSVFQNEAWARRAIEWATTPRWRAGLNRPGDSAWYRRKLHRYRARSAHERVRGAEAR
jgi:hypothetical protein